jgi:hypothetical protein
MDEISYLYPHRYAGVSLAKMSLATNFVETLQSGGTILLLVRTGFEQVFLDSIYVRKKETQYEHSRNSKLNFENKNIVSRIQFTNSDCMYFRHLSKFPKSIAGCSFGSTYMHVALYHSCRSWLSIYYQRP